MFGKKKRIIETQAALIADFREEIERKVNMIDSQTEIIYQLMEENAALKDIIRNSSEFKSFVNIDFPNSQKGGSDHTGAVNVSDILQN